MSQAAKVQEPSMEEILASIRRIIADDEAKPVARPAEPAIVEAIAPQPAKMTNIPPSQLRVAQAPPKSAPQPAPASNSQDDIDALLAGLDAATDAPEPRTVAAPQPQPEADVLELTDDMALPAAQAGFRTVEPEGDLEFTEPSPPAPQAPPLRAREPVSEQAPEPVQPAPAAAAPLQQQMLSRSTAAAVESAFNSLANTVLSNNARTLEDLVREMLRPMLKSWLDDNLPQLVERIVRAEIERVARGR